MIYNMYIFNRQGVCLFYEEWNRPYNPLADDPAEDQKLMFGIMFSLKQFCQKLSPRPNEDTLHCYRTPEYTCHFYETASGLKFIINTDSGTKDLQQELRHIYANIYVEFVAKNALYSQATSARITSHLFHTHLQQYIASLPCSKGPY